MFRPLKACKTVISRIQYPCVVQPKLDGIRCLMVNGVAMSRAMKPIPNLHIQATLTGHGLDGELVCGNFNETQSAVMSRAGQPGFQYHVFDNFAAPGAYWERYNTLLDQPHVVPYTVVEDEDALLAFEAQQLALGHEGIVIRSPHGPYKYGRSTVNEGYLMKLKRFCDSEATILGFVEAMENTNEIVPNAYGLTTRPGGRSGKEPKGTLGGFQLRDVQTGVIFECGTGIGLTADLRQRIWDSKADYLLKVIRYTYQPGKDKPRFPSFQGFRED